MKPWRIAVWSAAAFTVLAILVLLGLLDGLDSMVRNWLIPALGGALMAAALLLQAAHWFTDIVGGALLAAAVLGAVTSLTKWMHHQSANDHESARSGQPNGTRLTDSMFIARLNNAVPARARVDCYAPGREKFILRSCGGL